MNIDTTEIVMRKDLLSEELERHIPIPDAELPRVRKMSKKSRKGWMRNRPCICGSGRKFKVCCWGKL